MSLTPARRSAVAPFLVMDVLAAANRLEAEGRRIIHMEIGEPGAPAPQAVRAAAAAALAEGRIGYTEALGTAALRARIARHYGERYGVAVPAGRIAVTPGSSGAFTLAFLALFEPGERVALPAPGYPAYRNILTALSLEVVEIPTGPETRWQVTPAHLEALLGEGPLAGLVVASPANPSGTLMTPAGVADLVSACRDAGVRLIMDEIYHGLVYAGEETTALAHGDDVTVVNSFSKYFCMTGWRVGWAVLPEPLVRPVERLAQNLFISAPALSQRAALAAFDAREELEAVKAGYAKNRALLLERLPAMGLGDFLPVDGAFYVYLDVRRLTDDSTDFARRLLLEAGVAATPGPDFDTARGQGFLRLSFAGRQEDVAEACTRMAAWLG